MFNIAKRIKIVLLEDADVGKFELKNNIAGGSKGGSE